MYIAQSKHPSVAEQHARLRAAEISVKNAAARNGWKVPSARREELREKVEFLSDGRNTVLYTAEGVPGIYVRVSADRFRGGLGTELGEPIHEAFIVGTKEIPAFYLAKYQAAAVNHSTGAFILDPTSAPADGRIMSLPGLDPVANISFDVSLSLCQQNGAGFHLQTNAEWSYLLLKSIEGGFEPRGSNNNLGGDTVRTDERSDLPQLGSIRRSLSGSGPWSWTHDMTPYGCWDLNGNVSEWTGGLRWNAGRINVIKNNDAALGAEADQGSGAGD
jgi:formylglycine-generating enzyme